MDQRSDRVNWLNEFCQELESKITDLRQQLQEPKKVARIEKKRHSKSSTNDKNEKLERIKALTTDLDKLRSIEKKLQQENIFDENLWVEFQQLLETLYENVDNPDHNKELKQVNQKMNDHQIQKKIYDRIEANYNQIQKKVNLSDKLAKFFSRQQTKKLEPINLNEITQHQQLIDQNSLSYKLKMLEISFKNIPQGSDYYPAPSSKEKLKDNSLFPKYKMLTHQIFPKLQNETLFYVFYHYIEPYEQHLASRELKNRGWMFHRKYQMWFKKADCKVAFEQNEKFIKGNFIYYDTDKHWATRKKNDFTFKHKHQVTDNE